MDRSHEFLHALLKYHSNSALHCRWFEHSPQRSSVETTETCTQFVGIE